MFQAIGTKKLASRIVLSGLAALLSLYPIQMVKAEHDRVNYEDPNLAFSDGYVSARTVSCISLTALGEASDECLKKQSETTADGSEELALSADNTNAKAPH